MTFNDTSELYRHERKEKEISGGKSKVCKEQKKNEVNGIAFNKAGNLGYACLWWWQERRAARGSFNRKDRRG